MDGSEICAHPKTGNKSQAYLSTTIILPYLSLEALQISIYWGLFSNPVYDTYDIPLSGDGSSNGSGFNYKPIQTGGTKQMNKTAVEEEILGEVNKLKRLWGIEEPLRLSGGFYQNYCNLSLTNRKIRKKKRQTWAGVLTQELGYLPETETLSLIHISSPRDGLLSRMPSSA